MRATSTQTDPKEIQGEIMPEAVTVKTEVQTIDGTPDKRVFWSIVADYGLRTGI